MISYESLIDEYYNTGKTVATFDKECVSLGPRDNKPFQQIAIPLHESLSDPKARRTRSLQNIFFGCKRSFEDSKDGRLDSTRGDLHDVTVRCSENGGPDVEYTLNGIAQNEMPVIGEFPLNLWLILRVTR